MNWIYFRTVHLVPVSLITDTLLPCHLCNISGQWMKHISIIFLHFPSYLILELVLLSFSLVTNFASPKGIEIKTKWLSQVACRHHKLRNFCARLNHFLGVYGKNGDCHVLHFSVLFIFRLFSKKSKQAILFRNFLHEKSINRKNKVYHDKEHEKTKRMVVFIFSIDPQKVV